jgi:hypothetical protein
MKTLIGAISVLAVSCFLFFSCSSSDKTVSHELTKGDYSFTLSSDDNKTLLKGTLTVESISGEDITGKYKRTSLLDTNYSALIRLEEGEYTGKFIAGTGTFGINLNPKVADNNVFLNGIVYGNTIEGSWNHSVMRGSTGKGKFKAVLK